MIQSYINIYPLFFRLFSHIGHYRILSRAPCTIQVLVSILYTDASLFIFFPHYSPLPSPLSPKLYDYPTSFPQFPHVAVITLCFPTLWRSSTSNCSGVSLCAVSEVSSPMTYVSKIISLLLHERAGYHAK